MEWTSAQQQVLDHRGCWLDARGAAGAGKTSVLVERWRRASTSGHPERVLVLCPSRGAADRFRKAALEDRWWAGDDLPFTTLYGVAFDLVRRYRGERRLLTRAEQWSVVRRVLAHDRAALWPSCPEFVERAAFVDEVAAAVVALEAVCATDDAVLAVASSTGEGERWADLVAFGVRYRQVTEAMGALDGAQLFTAATEILGDPAVAATESGRWDEVLIDDAEVVTGSMGRLLEGLAPASLIAAGEVRSEEPVGGARRWFDQFAWPTTVHLGERHRLPSAPSLIRCRHPSSEPDAVAGVLLEAHEKGIPWRDMAVLLRSERQRAQGIGRALARHGIPVRMTPGSPGAEPAVQAVVDFFVWAGGDDDALQRLLVSPALDLKPSELRHLRRAAMLGGSSLPGQPQLAQLVALRDRLAPRLTSADPAELAYEAWIGLLAGLVPDPDSEGIDVIGTRALDAVSAFIAGVSKRSAHDRDWRIADELALVEGPDFDPDPWVSLAPSPEDDLVTVSTIVAARGRAWDTVVVAGCLEGELPRASRAVRFFDPAIAELAAERARKGAECALPSLAQRRQASLEDERRLFALAISRARRQVVATAAPAPGQLVSRFVAEAAPAAMRLVRSRAALGTGGLSPAPETKGTVPIHAGGRLSLSASRLMTYGDCPLRYFYQYTLGVRGPGGVAASIGIVVHAALAAFLDPRGSPDRSWAALETVAERLWFESGSAETIAPYQPMREQARRDVFGMLEDWWHEESAQADATGAWPDVLAVEYPFDITVGGHRVRGSIDRIDRVPGGIGIIDYKTGSKVPKPEDVAEDLQLATYHLAAVRDPRLAAFGPPVSLQLCYLRKGAEPSQPITTEHAERTEQLIIEAANHILNEDFEPSVDAECDYCEFWRLCPLQIQGRQVGGE